MDKLQAGLNNDAVQNVAKRFGGRFKLLFFSCAACVTAAGALSIIVGIGSMAAPFDFINYTYLTLFGLLMLLIDLPIDNITIRELKIGIFTYALFMTRFVGRGFWYLFLAAMTVGSLWDNDISPFLGFILGGYIAAVAIYSMFFGWNLSRKLDIFRMRIRSHGPDQWAAYVPPLGMTKVQFRDLADSLSGFKFTEEELQYIVEGFSFSVRGVDDIISREEFEEWVTSPTMMIL